MSTRRRRAREITAADAAATPWDLVVIGAGSAGLVASRSAALLGASVLLIEAHRWGGECLHTGCVPSKSLIAVAHAVHTARHSTDLGIDVDSVRVDFPRVMRHVHAAIAAIEPVDSPEALVEDGIHVLRGRARFVDESGVQVDGHRIAFRDAAIATGSRPVLADIPGSDGVDILTNETLWDLDALPARLLVQGGGAIGCEIAQAMARLGSSVTLVHRGDRLLPKEEPAASTLIRAALERDGVDVRLRTEIVEFTARAGAVPSDAGVARLSAGGDVAFDRVLAALGRRVDTSALGLESAGVRTDDSGAVAVDAALATSNPRIRAAGDATPLPRFTHTAGTYGSVAATNAVLGLARRADTEVVPRVTFTAPEVGAVGVAPRDAARLGMRVLVQDHAHLDRAIAEGEVRGSTTLVVDRRGRLRGASIVGSRAGETLGEMTVAIRAGLTARQLATTIHAYPTYSDAAWNALVREAQRSLASGVVARAIRVLRSLHRRRRSR